MQEFATQTHDKFPENVREYHFYRFPYGFYQFWSNSRKPSVLFETRENWNTEISIETIEYIERNRNESQPVSPYF